MLTDAGQVHKGSAARGGEMPQPVSTPGELLPGELFEDCRYHPCLCIEANSPEDVDGVHGISLVDGTPCGCSIWHCGLRKLTVAEAVQWKYHGPNDVVVEDHWWERWPQKNAKPERGSA
jgi:hypothetical protein